jgi:two-component system, chemotaxis family, sensor kinase CheA
LSDDAASRTEFEQFLAEYYAECDEHLDAARRCLLALEASMGGAEPDRELLDELFRSFHSIKGLSAMVSIGEAEALAHHLESYLGELRRGHLRLNANGLEVLISGVKTLDHILAARRNHTPGPDSAPLLADLAVLVRERPAPKPATVSTQSQSPKTTIQSAEDDRRLAAQLKPGARAWNFTFVPTQALAAKGINVNSVRGRLQELGEILHAAPAVLPGGQISFSFIVGSTQPEATILAWNEDGLSVRPHEFALVREESTERSNSDTETSSSPVPSLASSSVVRVDLGRLDDLMQKVGELVLSRARLEESVRRLRSIVSPPEWRSLEETNLAMERQLRDLREGVMRVRMVPFREIFARMQFVIRDLAHEFHKQVSLELTGEATEIDKFVVERMMDPLLHLVRNAVGHGLETPEERLASGKPAEAHIALRARTTGEKVTLEVEDDGRGIDAEKVFARARAIGMLSPDAGTDPTLLLDVLCMPGFSIRELADRVSGRGVGMDVVRRAVEELNGSLTLQTVPGKSTRFAIELPLTLAIADALIVTVEGQRYAIPQAAVREVLQIAPGAVHTLEHNEIISYRTGVLPLMRLGALFGGAVRTNGDFFVLVIGEGVHALGITVDRILGLREIVVRPLTDEMVQVDGIAGATELGDGRVVLILDAAGLMRTAKRANRVRPPARSA